MNGPPFTITQHPASDEVVEVLLEPGVDDVQRIRLARWCAHLGQWIHDWTRRPILDEVAGWREQTRCGCELARMQIKGK